MNISRNIVNDACMNNNRLFRLFATVKHHLSLLGLLNYVIILSDKQTLLEYIIYIIHENVWCGPTAPSHAYIVQGDQLINARHSFSSCQVLHSYGGFFRFYTVQYTNVSLKLSGTDVFFFFYRAETTVRLWKKPTWITRKGNLYNYIKRSETGFGFLCVCIFVLEIHRSNRIPYKFVLWFWNSNFKKYVAKFRFFSSHGIFCRPISFYRWVYAVFFFNNK